MSAIGWLQRMKEAKAEFRQFKMGWSDSQKEEAHRKYKEPQMTNFGGDLQEPLLQPEATES